MTNIQTPEFTVARHPWSVDGSADVLKADGKSIANCSSLERANQIADALNRTADLEAKLATAKEGVTKAIHQLLHPGTDAYSGEHYVSWAIGHLEEALATISGDTKGDDDGK